MSHKGEQREPVHSSDKPTIAARPPELEDWLNGVLYHPLAGRLALWLLPTAVTPNVVSIVGGALVVIAAVIYASPLAAEGAVLALLCHMAWHVLDGADGDLARLRGTSSAHGEIIDGLCDYAGHIVLYLVLGWLLEKQIGPLAWLLAVAAGAARIVQANHYEVQRRSYQSWVYGTSWLRTSQASGEGSRGVVEDLGTGYLALAALLAPDADRLDEAARTLKGSARERFRSIIRAEYVPVLARLTLLSANYRTIALGASMIVAQSALYYFMFEILVLSIVLVASILRVRRATASILARI